MMASPSPASMRFEENKSAWPYSSRPTKRHKRTSGGNTSGPSPREIGFMRESQNDGSATFLGSSSGIHFIRHVYHAFARRSADLDQSRARDRTSVPGEDDRLQRNAGSIQSSDEIWTREELNHAPNISFTFDDLVIWTRSYFENWHMIFPCLHAPTVLKTMETVSQKGTGSVNRSELMIIRSIMSISLGDNRQKTSSRSKLSPVPSVLVFRSIQHVIQDVQSLLEDPTSLPLLQAAFTAQLALTSLLRLNAASRVGGVITRTAFHLGLHRCPRRFSCFSSEEADIRCRLFWSIYSLERYLSQALGIPLSIRDDDIDVCYPGAERHSSIIKFPDDRRLRLLCHLAKFARIRGLIVELRNKSILHCHASQAEATHVTGELAQWWNEVYDDANPIDEPPEDDLEQEPVLRRYHRLLLMILRHEAIISLNRPLLASEKPSADYKNALQTCIGSSRSILAALKKHMSSEPQSPLSWPCFTWSTWMACLILMYAAWEEEFSTPTALKYARMGIAILENLSLRGSSWPETCIEAIKGMQSAFQTQASSVQKAKASAATVNGAERLTQSPAQATPLTNKRISRMLPVQDGNDEIGDAGLTPIRPRALTPNGYEGHPVPTGIHPFQSSIRSPIQGLSSTENYDSAVFSPSDNIGNFAETLDPAENYLSGHSSAGLVFGNMADGNPAFNPSFSGQDSLPFSSSMPMNDLWSVADGPWMIHNNFL
ncbi:uncharacterized protein N7479_003738 [Penicillium vulpinum]|uniref:uncharacterized protein n=1 Tax=Penicillium vulpinum TaxID=29845 RepID=UPI002547FDBC|nr:uncharacterized protein N7479_003738 [Penicillium vulpinum]KAJ5963862.1 hypothetical protein N7479_003738 [Penicillium vulpinum]